MIRSRTRGLRTVAIASVAALAFAAGVPQALAQTDAKWKIDTYTPCVGVCGSLGSFGNPDTATYGQTLTMPDGVKKFKNVQWFMVGPVGGTIKLRSEVYTWDGAKAGTLVAESKAKSYTFVDSSMVKFKFKFKKAKVQAGQQYVVFATVSKDYEETGAGVLTTWLVDDKNPLDGGQTVWLNDSGDESQWTTTPWSGIPSYDMAFKAKIK